GQSERIADIEGDDVIGHALAGAHAGELDERWSEPLTPASDVLLVSAGIGRHEPRHTASRRGPAGAACFGRAGIAGYVTTARLASLTLSGSPHVSRAQGEARRQRVRLCQRAAWRVNGFCCLARGREIATVNGYAPGKFEVSDADTMLKQTW